MKIKLLVAILAGILGISTCALAIVPPDITLHDAANPNSTVNISPSNQTGIHNWTVGLYNQMSQSSFWYRIGGTGFASPMTSLTFDRIEQPDATTATVFYTGADFNLSVLYSLGPGAVSGPGTSDISEIVTVHNNRTTALTFHLFEYVNFDLNGTAPAETATRISSSNITQTEGTASGQIGALKIPARWEIGDALTLLNKLNSPTFTDLASASLPYTATTPYTGDAAFAFQWSSSIAAGIDYQMSHDLLVQGAIVPEPSSAVALLGALGLIVPALRRRRQ